MQEKLDRLAKIDKQNRDRANRYLERQRKEGKQPISAILEAGAYDSLCRLKDAAIQAKEPATTGDILSALLTTEQTLVPTAGDVSAQIQDTLEPEHIKGKDSKQFEMFDAEQVELDSDSLELIDPGPEETLRLTLIEYHGLPGTWAQRTDKLNGLGITTVNGLSWTKDNLRIASNKAFEAQK